MEILYQVIKKFASTNKAFKRLQCNGVAIWAKIADTDEARQKGLAGVSVLGPNEGMLFDFQDGERERYFHMKGCHFDIEAIALSDNGVVMGICLMDHQQPNVMHRLPTCAKVLEVKSGFCEQNKIASGDVIRGIGVEHTRP